MRASAQTGLDHKHDWQVEVVDLPQAGNWMNHSNQPCYPDLTITGVNIYLL